jgi:hypothetical protein
MAHGYMRDFDEDRGERDRWRSEDRQRGWRASDRDRNERNLSFMLGDRDRNWERAPRGFSSRQDDHYLSWRDKQMEALDRDYAEYCREREQQFHSDFDAWRNQRHGNQQPLQAGMTQTSQAGDPTGELELTNEMSDPRADQPDPMADATLGTTSSRKR